MNEPTAQREMSSDAYPVSFAIDYPDRQLNRLTTFFRVFTVIPIAILMAAITGFSTGGRAGDTTTTLVVT